MTPPNLRAELVETGRSYSSEETLAQAEKTLNAYESYASVVQEHGFAAEDAERLAIVRDALASAGVTRSDAVGTKRVTRKGLAEAQDSAGSLRLTARSGLEGIRDRLIEDGVTTGVNIVKDALERTRVQEDSADKMRLQLEILATAYRHEAVAPVAAGRKLGTMAERLSTSAAALQAAHAAIATPRGTPAETEELDHLDGWVVRLARRANKAAKAASRALGNPAIAQAFKLDQLYRRRKNRSGEGGAAS